MGNFEFKKKFGQNFLSDELLLSEIVSKAGVTKEDTVVEIGAGKGALTTALSKEAGKVFSFEIDNDLFGYLEEKFSGTNVQFVFKDIMDYSDKELEKLTGGKFKLVANLPYYVTSPIITRFLQNRNLESLTVMVQEEVADRIIASPKSKEYGVLTIICGLFGEAKKVLRVGREKFYPVPNVDSAVIKIDRKSDVTENFKPLIAFVKRAFAMRRKKLSANLATEKLNKSEIEHMLQEVGFSADVRAEELSISDFKMLFELFSAKM